MPQPAIQPYLFFAGRCEEALEFYKSALGAHVDMLMRFSDSPEPCDSGAFPAGYENKVMHAGFRIGQSALMASDGCGNEPPFGGFALALSVPTEAEADKYFNALAERGTVTMPLDKTFWSPLFGMLTDRFGLGWMISTEPAAGTGPS
jgi:PhnB protein